MFDRIKESVQKFSRNAVADEEAVEELVNDIQRDLIQADVDIELVQELSDSIRSEALKEEAPEGLTRKEHVLEVVYGKLEALLGEEAEPQQEPHTVLLCGLFGAGKTTTAGKIADFYRKRELKPGLIAADTDRPAAVDQLEQIAGQVGAEFYGEKDADDPVEVVRRGRQELDADVVVVDSAGRNSLDAPLREELSEISEVAEPDERYLVTPADLGQSAGSQAEEFADAVDITGVVVTKMDSSAKAGGALIACQKAGSQVEFVGTGEEMHDLEVFDPVSFVEDMLGQPDLESLLEKVEELDADPGELLEGEFTLEDFREQISQVTDTGIMEDMMQQLPIGGQMPDNLADITEQKVGSYETIMESMTEEEMRDPDVIGRDRRERIAHGAGVPEEEVRELLKHFRQTRNMMDKMGSGGRGNMQQMMQKLGL
nr:MAG: signal recognition particle GTPase [Candidatus Nanosalinarum sp. J07AB56]